MYGLFADASICWSQTNYPERKRVPGMHLLLALKAIVVHLGTYVGNHYDDDATNPRHQNTYQQHGNDRIPSTTPGAEPPRDAKDSGSARSHSTHLETSSSDRP